MATDLGTGATLTGAGIDSTLFAEILSMDWSGIARESIEISHMGTAGGTTFIPSDLYDPGELAVELNFAQGSIFEVDAAPNAVVVTVKNGAATNTWSANGFITSLDWSVPLEDKMTANATIKFTDEITVG